MGSDYILKEHLFFSTYLFFSGPAKKIARDWPVILGNFLKVDCPSVDCGEFCYKIYQHTLREPYFCFLSNWKKYYRGDGPANRKSFRFYTYVGFHLVQNRWENCHHDHITFNLKGNGNIIL